MQWIINFIYDYFECKECEKYHDREMELRKLIRDLIDTQTKLLEYIE
jgi:hypothetical protein